MKPVAWIVVVALAVLTATSAMLQGCRNAEVTAGFPDEWFFEGNQPKLVGRPAPPLMVTQWHNGEAVTLEDLRGEIVLLDFWGSWCGPCRRAMPHTNAIAAEFWSEGVRVLGIHSQRGHENMVKAADELDMGFPTGKDEKGVTARDYGAPFWPFYVLIDRRGVVRAAGLTPEYVDEAVRALLVEQPHR